ncbi:MAG: helix-turn-helix domain-containing protein [Caloramator sp.]|nr:helix-turn-helix domain-containing protein [Caloramator sp.]
MKTYKLSQVAEILQVTPKTVRAEIERNRLKSIKVGTEIRITEEQLMEYMQIKANRGMTQREAELEKENARLKAELEKAMKFISLLKNELLKIS